MICPHCQQPNPDDALFCQNCRAPLQQATNANKKKSNNKSMVIISVALGLVIVAAAVFAVLILLKDKPDNGKDTEGTTAVTAAATAEAVTEENTTAPVTEVSTEPTTIVIRPETTSSVAVSTLAPYSTTIPSTTVSDWRNAPANQLYRPPQSSFLTTQYQAYVYCTDSGVQDYVKMRLGPSNTAFNTVGSAIPNYQIVTVETSPVNGWALCYYVNSATEGWIRTDYLFRDASKLPGQTTTATKPPTTASSSNDDLIIHRDNGYDYVRSGYYRVVTGDGDPLRLREDSNLNGKILYNIPEGTIVYVEENSYYVNGWVYVKFEQNGHHEGFVYFQYLQPNF